jgi:hypothetical protein
MIAREAAFLALVRRVLTGGQRGTHCCGSGLRSRLLAMLALDARKLWWGLAEVAVVAWAVSCGKVEDSNDVAAAEGGGGTSTGGELTGGTVTGGAGTIGPNSGGASGVGGAILIPPDDPPPTVESCGELPVDFLDPPCSPDDLIAPGECAFDTTRSVHFPLEGLVTPTGVLQLVLLPLDRSLGAGGEGSMVASLPLLVWFSSPSYGEVMGDSFRVLEGGTEVYSQIFPDEPEFAPYVAHFESGGEVWHVARLALLEGSRVVRERRVIFEPNFGCIVK